MPPCQGGDRQFESGRDRWFGLYYSVRLCVLPGPWWGAAASSRVDNLPGSRDKEAGFGEIALGSGDRVRLHGLPKSAWKEHAGEHASGLCTTPRFVGEASEGVPQVLTIGAGSLCG